MKLIPLLALKYGIILFCLYQPKPDISEKPDSPFVAFPNATLFVTERTVNEPAGSDHYWDFPIYSYDAPKKRTMRHSLLLAKKKQGNTVAMDGDVLVFVDDQRDLFGHYFHFMEQLVGAWNYLTYKNPDQVKLILICFHQHLPNEENWNNGTKGGNMMLLEALFPNAKIARIEDIPQNIDLQAQNIFVSSRVRSHGIPGSTFINMNGGVRTGYEPYRLRMLRDHVFAALNIKSERSDTLRITYCKRTTGRIMDPIIETQLLTAIEKLTGTPVNVVDFAKIEFKQQLQTVANTDLFIGLHGNGLTHLLFLPNNAAVLEYHSGEKSAFFRIFAQMRGINYYSNSKHRWFDATEQDLYNDSQGDVTELDLAGTLHLIQKLAAQKAT